MDIFKICEIITIVVTLIVSNIMVKKNPEKCKNAMVDAFALSFYVFVPFGFIQTLAVFGIELFDTSFEIPWAFTPLGILATMSLFLLVRLLGFGRQTILDRIGGWEYMFRGKPSAKQQDAEKQDDNQQS